jgi:hypothetical protein
MGVLPPGNDAAFNIAPRSTRAPSAIAKNTQVVSSDAGIWTCVLSDVDVRGRDKVLTFRAIGVMLEGMLNPILIPRCRGYQPFDPDDAELYEPVPHDDDATFDDGTSYVGLVIDVVAASGANAGATSLTITVNYAGTIQPGQDFSIGERMYRIKSIDGTTLTFRPPLREAVSAGARLNFDDPVCRMRQATDDEMNLELQLRNTAKPTVRFIEDV